MFPHLICWDKITFRVVDWKLPKSRVLMGKDIPSVITLNCSRVRGFEGDNIGLGVCRVRGDRAAVSHC